MTAAALREAITRLIASGQLVDPQNLRLEQPHLVLEIDDHLSDEAIGGGRLRVVLRSARELYVIARALEDSAAFWQHEESDEKGER
jgi:hypothetical protein